MEMETAMLESPYESFHNQEVKKSSDTSSMEKSSDASSMEKREKIYVWLCGVLTLTPIMLIMLMLLSLPTVFYTLQKKSRSIVRLFVSTLHISHMKANPKHYYCEISALRMHGNNRSVLVTKINRAEVTG